MTNVVLQSSVAHVLPSGHDIWTWYRDMTSAHVLQWCSCLAIWTWHLDMTIVVLHNLAYGGVVVWLVMITRICGAYHWIKHSNTQLDGHDCAAGRVGSLQSLGWQHPSAIWCTSSSCRTWSLLCEPCRDQTTWSWALQGHMYMCCMAIALNNNMEARVLHLLNDVHCIASHQHVWTKCDSIILSDTFHRINTIACVQKHLIILPRTSLLCWSSPVLLWLSRRSTRKSSFPQVRRQRWGAWHMQIVCCKHFTLLNSVTAFHLAYIWTSGNVAQCIRRSYCNAWLLRFCCFSFFAHYV